MPNLPQNFGPNMSLIHHNSPIPMGGQNNIKKKKKREPISFLIKINTEFDLERNVTI